MNHLEIKKQILEKIKQNDNIIIVRHIRPDGDCMGSSIGLREILRASFPNKKIYSVGKTRAEYLDFIGAEDEIIDKQLYKESLVIAVDTATSDRIDDDYFKDAKEFIKIDHHLAVEDYAEINYVREDFPAASCIVVDFYDTFRDELVMPKNAAIALYVGLTTDTGRFRYRGVGSRVFELAAILMEHDLDIETIYAKLYLKDAGSLKLQGLIYKNFKTTENGVVYMHITQRMMKKYNLSYDSAAALINSLDSIKGNLIWIFFIDQKDKTIRVRIRSRFVPVVSVGRAYRGGGHPNACGATVHNKKELKELVKMADNLLKEYKENNEGWL